MRQRTPLKRAIFDREIVQKDLAEALGIDPGSLSRIVGGAPCSIELAQRIADEIDVPIAELFPAHSAAA